jgi:hypothetical protein
VADAGCEQLQAGARRATIASEGALLTGTDEYNLFVLRQRGIFVSE